MFRHSVKPKVIIFILSCRNTLHASDVTGESGNKDILVLLQRFILVLPFALISRSKAFRLTTKCLLSAFIAVLFVSY